MTSPARAFRQTRRRSTRQRAITLDGVEAAFGQACGLGVTVSGEVPLRQVVGTVARGEDFARELRPFAGHIAARWQSVHRAREQGRDLGCVSLIQAGDFYLVDDGHHRTSVASAGGQVAIDACVRVLCTPRSACLACLPDGVPA